MPKKHIDLSKCRFEMAKAADINPTLNFIEKNFFKDDPLCKSLSFCRRKLEGPTENLIRDGVKQGMSILVREDTKENEIIGVCVNTRNCPWDGDKLDEYARVVENGDMKKLLHIWALMSREPRLHQELGQLSIFEMGILAVKKSHAGQGLGTELVRRSLDLGRDLNFMFARMNCTSDYALKIGDKLNMTKLWDVPYKNILMHDGKTPLTIPEFPHSMAAVYYINLKNPMNEKIVE